MGCYGAITKSYMFFIAFHGLLYRIIFDGVSYDIEEKNVTQ